MIDRKHKLPVAHQCSLLGVARSSAYDTPREVSAEDLALMRRINELHLEHPFAGARMLRDLLRPEGFQAGRRHIGTLMARMEVSSRCCRFACWLSPVARRTSAKNSPIRVSNAAWRASDLVNASVSLSENSAALVWPTWRRSPARSWKPC